MKKRNKYWELDKEYLRLNKELANNRAAQRALGWVELEIPIPRGFNAFFILREDIANRADAEIFQTIINICGRTGWRRKNTFETVKDRRSKPWTHVSYFYDYPKFENIDEYTFQKYFPVGAKKWFSESIDRLGIKWYSSNVPLFFFEVKVEQDFKTKVKLIDEVLLQEEAFLEHKVSLFFNRSWRGRSGAPKDYRKGYHRSDRMQTKLAIDKIVNKGLDEGEVTFPYNHRHSANWDWW